MKKSKPAVRKPASKKNAAPKTVAEYLARVPRPARNAITRLRAAVRSSVPKDAAEIISYSIPAFKTNKVLVWFSAFSDHCSLFPTAAVIAEFKRELKGFSTSKGTIQFPLDRPLPAALIKKIVKARLAHSERHPTPKTKVGK
ncbi:MAG: iron chaperone [Candidatus Acidiferrales bacterium]